MARKKGRHVIVCFDEDLIFKGVYLSVRHATNVLGEDVNINSAVSIIAQYLRGERQDCYGLIFVRYDIGNRSIETHEIREDAKKLARQRLRNNILARHLSEVAMSKLTDKELDKIYAKIASGTD